MQSPEVDLIQEKSNDPRVLEVFNALRANPKNTLVETLFKAAVVVVENDDLHEKLTGARTHIDALELELAALAGDKPNDVLKAVLDEHDLKSRVNEMEAMIKGSNPALTIGEATNGWAMTMVQLGGAVAQLKDARNANAELTIQLAAAQRGILTAHDLPSAMTNNDPSFQYSATDPRIKFLVEEFANIPGLTLNMAVDRWAMYSLDLAELRLELERYQKDSQKKRFAANVNAETALDLNGAKVVRHKTDSKRGKDGVAGKKKKTNEVKDAVFKWCDEHRRVTPNRNLFASDIGELLKNEPVMHARKVDTLTGFVRQWEMEKKFQRTP
jgi:hypothetical protein